MSGTITWDIFKTFFLYICTYENINTYIQKWCMCVNINTDTHMCVSFFQNIITQREKNW